MKMTAQEYARRVKKVGPHSPLGTDCLWAFGVGGGICLLGEVLRQRYLALGLEADLAGTLTSCTLIALSAVLTTLGLYQKLAARAGAGSLVPITGFANAVVSAAIEFKTEGRILGTGAKMFTIAGPVIVYGTLSAVVYGGVLWLLGGTASACGANFAALLCYFLLGCAAIAMGEFLSGLTENPIIAAVAGFSVLLLAYMMPSLRSLFNAGSAVALAVFTAIAGAASLMAGLRTRSFILGCLTFAALCLGLTGLFLLQSAWLTEAFSAVLSVLCFFTPFEDFVNNSFSLPTLVYYLTVTGMFLFFTVQSIEKRRWN